MHTKLARGASVVCLITSLAVLGLPATTAHAQVAAAPSGFVTLSPLTAPTTEQTLTAGADSPITIAGIPSGATSALVEVAVRNTTPNSPGQTGPPLNSAGGLYLWPTGDSQPPARNAEILVSTTLWSTTTTVVRVSASEPTSFRTRSTAFTGSTAEMKVRAVGVWGVTKSCFGTCVYDTRYTPSDAVTVFDGRADSEAIGPGQSKPISIAGQPGVSPSATRATVRVTALSVATPSKEWRRVEVVPAPGATPTAAQTAVVLPDGTATAESRSSKVITTDLVTGSLTIQVPAGEGPLLNEPVSGRTRKWSNAPDLSDTDNEGGVVDTTGAQIRVVVEVLGTFAGTQYTPAAPRPRPAFDVTSAAPHELTVTSIDGTGHSSGGFAMLSVTLSLQVTATAAGTLSVGNLTGAGGQTLEVRPGFTITAQVTVPVDGTGKVPVGFSGPGTATVTPTFEGWHEFSVPTASSLGARFSPTTPTVVIPGSSTALSAGTIQEVTVTGLAGVPSHGASTVVLQVRAYAASAPASVRVGPPRPDGVPVAATDQVHTSLFRPAVQLVTVPLGPDGRVAVMVSGSAAKVEVSVVGWHTPFHGDGADRVLVVGDSLTAGITEKLHTALRPDAQSSILGNSGYVTHEQRWFAAERAGSRPTDAIVNLGTNDLYGWLYGITDASFAAQLSALLEQDLANVPCRFVVTIGEHPPTVHLDGVPRESYRFNDRIYEIAGIETHPADRVSRTALDPGQAVPGVGLIDWRSATANADRRAEWFPATDPIHPNGEGDKVMIALYRYALGYEVTAAEVALLGISLDDLDAWTHPC